MLTTVTLGKFFDDQRTIMQVDYVTFSVNCGGRERTIPAVPDPLRKFGQLLRGSGDASDVTITIELPDGHSELLVAVEAGSVFVGLVTADGVYEYVADEQAEGTLQCIIGCAPTFVDTRYVLQVTAAIDLLTPWIAGPLHFPRPDGKGVNLREPLADEHPVLPQKAQHRCAPVIVIRDF